MKIWTDKKGKRVDGKEFLRRFKSGVEGITPLQQVKTQLWSTLPIFAGIIWGLIYSLTIKTYWLALILGGALPMQFIGTVGIYQKYIALKFTEGIMKNLEMNKEVKKDERQTEKKKG